MKLPAVIVPLEQSRPLLRPTDAVFVLNDPRRGFMMGKLLRVMLEGVGKEER
jgi:hypothetical protein